MLAGERAHGMRLHAAGRGRRTTTTGLDAGRGRRRTKRLLMSGWGKWVSYWILALVVLRTVRVR